MRQYVRKLLVVVMGCALFLPAAHAQTWPSKPVRIVVGFAAGGTTDALARQLATLLSKSLGQSFVVENKPGGNTVIAGQLLAAAPADGYTLGVFENTTPAIAPALYKQPPYTQHAFEPITQVVENAQILLAPPDSPVSTLEDFLALARNNPGTPYGSPGTAGLTMLEFERFHRMADLQMTHVAYKGSAPASADLMAGHIPFAALDVGSTMSAIQANKIKPIAVTSAQRLALLPDTPTIAESGFPQFQAMAWFGVFAPAGTPETIVKALDAALQDAVTSNAFQEWAAAQSLFVRVSANPAEFKATVARDAARLAQTIQTLGLSVDD